MSDVRELIGELLSEAAFGDSDTCRLAQRAADALARLQAENLRLREELTEYENVFNSTWEADMRAVRRWQAAHPGKDLVHPDHANLCFWLLAEIERKDAALQDIKQKAGTHAVDRRVAESPLAVLDPGFAGIYAVADRALSPAEKRETRAEEWRPIETAPKDGTSVLLYVVQKPCAYTEATGRPEGWSHINAGFYNIDLREWSHEHSGEPTHWRPLPAPPKEPTR